ncbi:MAG TPA: HesA/MoeB/ThiF family protein, partial [Candidatus Nanoarchaeia archaeon]|nr:HesA/MoeB/ThiF family protein [Candidatus Nanoarchaeia archaeon]
MRYQKQELLSYIGNKQEFLQKKVVAIVGLGAIGSNTANLLARAGINLILIDRDIVELENLQRQTLYDEKDIGKPKSIQAKKKLKLINSEIKIEAFVEDLNYKNIDELINSDLILDCSDNMETRFLINDYSIKNDIPWIYAAVLGVNAMSMNIVPQKTPCFRCI